MRRTFFLAISLVILASLASFTPMPALALPLRARALFIGDIMAHDQQLDAAATRRNGAVEWDFAPQFRRVQPLFWGDALIVGNLETTFAGPERGYAGYPLFNTPDSLADALVGLGVHVVTLANNHILDRGAGGARRTVEVLNRAGILWTGLGLDDVPKNDALLVEHGGLRWAFVNYSYGSNRLLSSSDVHLNVISDSAISEGLARARTLSPDIIAACFHWGEEYHFVPSAHQRRAAETALAEGAHLVIGTHPHVLQPMEVSLASSVHGTDARLVAWSLGNFVSFQRTLPRERSCVLAVEVEKAAEDEGARLVRVSVAPTRVALVPSGGRRRAEVVYAGTGGSFNHAGLPASELDRTRRAGTRVLDFLGAGGEPDENGFYTLWSAEDPGRLPIPRLKSPRD